MEQLARSPEQIGHAIRRERQTENLTQADLAARARLLQSTVSRVEGGDHGAKLSTLFSLLAALDLELVVRPRTKLGPADFEDTF